MGGIASPAPANVEAPGLLDLPEALLDSVFRIFSLSDLAAAAGVSRSFAALAQRALLHKQQISAADLPLLSRQHNYLLLGGGAAEALAAAGVSTAGVVMGASSAGVFPSTSAPYGVGAGEGGSTAAERLRRRLFEYVPAALHYASRHCRELQRLHLELPAPQVPLTAAADAVARAVAGEPWQQPLAHLAAAAAVAAEGGCPPVDGYLLKLLAQCCPGLRSLRLVNIANNATMNRLVRLNDSCLTVLARSCTQLQELVIGQRGGEECMYHPAAPFYLEEVGDAGMRALAQNCRGLRRLGLLRCSRVGDDGLLAVAQMCSQLTALQLHDCPAVSDRALMAVGERCHQLRVLDCAVARRAGGLMGLMGEEAEQLGFRAVFTIAANCPRLEEFTVSEEGLEAAVLDDDCLVCLAQGCPGLRRLVLLHCGAVTDVGVGAVARRCKQLESLVLEHTGVGDAGVLAVARGLPLLRTLCITNYISSLGHLNFLPGSTRDIRGVSDVALQHIATHCTALRCLALTGSRRVTDRGLMHLAHLTLGGLGGSPSTLTPLARSFHSQLTSLTINHTAATDGSVCDLVQRCSQLRALSLRGLLFNADATVARVAASCRHITSLDLRHCSTLSDAGLAEVACLPFLRRLHLSFCVRITDSGLLLLAQLAPAAAAARAGSRARCGCGCGKECGQEAQYQGATECATAAAASSCYSSPAGSSRGTFQKSITSDDTWFAPATPYGTSSGSSRGSGGGGSSGCVTAVCRCGSAEEARSLPAWGAGEAAAPTPGWQAQGSQGGQGQGTSSGGGCTACSTCSTSGSTSGGTGLLLEELELYHVPQVTHRGIWALAQACHNLQHVNIGKCRLVRADSLCASLGRRGVRLSACHYLDS